MQAEPADLASWLGLSLSEARLGGLPAAGGVALVIGGGPPLILRAAARHAAVAALSGLGRTLPDGHHYHARWSRADLRRQLQLIEDKRGWPRPSP